MSLQSLPSAYIVHFSHYGLPSKSVFLDYGKASDYAIKFHGVLSPLYELEMANVLDNNTRLAKCEKVLEGTSLVVVDMNDCPNKDE